MPSRRHRAGALSNCSTAAVPTSPVLHHDAVANRPSLESAQPVSLPAMFAVLWDHLCAPSPPSAAWPLPPTTPSCAPAPTPQPESPTVLTREEVVRRLRALGEPATLFGEVGAAGGVGMWVFRCVCGSQCGGHGSGCHRSRARAWMRAVLVNGHGGGWWRRGCECGCTGGDGTGAVRNQGSCGSAHRQKRTLSGLLLSGPSHSHNNFLTVFHGEEYRQVS